MQVVREKRGEKDAQNHDKNEIDVTQEGCSIYTQHNKIINNK
jgi:hypothetical protein